MTKDQYLKILDWAREKPARRLFLLTMMRLIVAVSAAAYFLLLTWLAFEGNWVGFGRSLLVPGSGFAALSLLRRMAAAPRPCEYYGFEPLCPERSPNRSFPSRHTFSIFIIAVTLLPYVPAVGALLLALGCCLGALRVVCGLHFPQDVIAGAAMALIIGAVCHMLL